MSGETYPCPVDVFDGNDGKPKGECTLGSSDAEELHVVRQNWLSVATTLKCVGNPAGKTGNWMVSGCLAKEAMCQNKIDKSIKFKDTKTCAPADSLSIIKQGTRKLPLWADQVSKDQKAAFQAGLKEVAMKGSIMTVRGIRVQCNVGRPPSVGTPNEASPKFAEECDEKDASDKFLSYEPARDLRIKLVLTCEKPKSISPEKMKMMKAKIARLNKDIQDPKLKKKLLLGRLVVTKCIANQDHTIPVRQSMVVDGFRIKCNEIDDPTYEL